MALLSLPDELLNHIFAGVTPWDVAALAGCCARFRLLLRGNRGVFRGVYRGVLDEPPARPNNVEFDWIGEVQKYVKVVNILDDEVTPRYPQPLRNIEKTARILFVTDVLTSWMRTALPSSPPTVISKNVAKVSSLFAERENKEVFLQHSTIFGRARRDRLPVASSGPTDFLSAEERQMSAKLHVLYGVPIELPRRTHANAIYPYACSVVYDLRKYKLENFWGPYKSDGHYTADWERLEAIMIVLGHNLKTFSENTRGLVEPIWNIPWLGASPDSFPLAAISKTTTQSPPTNSLDPFNVSGTWMRVVCFLDFSELFAYNFNTQTLPEEEPRPPIETTEAIRLIIMEITVVRISDPSENEGLSPVVHFEGTSRSMHSQWDPNASSKIKGTVRLTREGEVRWTSVSVYQEEERWASEGIQVGGPKSARGVLGHWFDKDLDQHGPAGPTAFWKVSNDISSGPDSDDAAGESHDADDEEDEDYDEEIELEIDGVDDVSNLNADQIAAVLHALAGSHGHGHGHGHTH